MVWMVRGVSGVYCVMIMGIREIFIYNKMISSQGSLHQGHGCGCAAGRGNIGIVSNCSRPPMVP